MTKNYTINNLLFDFGDAIKKIIGDKDTIFNNFCSINSPKEKAITWISKKYHNDSICSFYNLPPSVFILEEDLGFSENKGKAFIIADNPKLFFISVLKKYFEKKYEYQIHSSAIISMEAIIAKNVYIGPNCIIGNCIIGSGAVIEGNNFIYDNVSIGENTIIQAGAIIGSKGMSLARDKFGILYDFPSLGKIIIEDNVEIGSNTVIDKAVIDDTIIGKGTKINSSSFIGNTVHIGENNYISVCVNINGSVKIGNCNFIGSGSSIRNKLIIGNNNTIGAGAVVVKNVGNNETIFGNPAKKQNIRGIVL